MKKMLFILMALLIATPVMAVSLTTSVNDALKQVTVGYAGNGATAATRVAGFGLVVSVDKGIITACTPAKTGESKASTPGYGITIPTMIFVDGSPTDYGSGIDPAKTGFPSAINSTMIRVSYGALYAPHGGGDVNAPGASGPLFTITVSSDCNVAIAETPDAPLSSNGVVFEDGSVPSPALTASAHVSGAVAPAAPTGLAASDGTSATQKSLTWTASSGATGYQVWYNNSNNSGSAVLLTTLGAVTSYNHVTNHGETTWYWLKATNGAGTSGFSMGDSGYLTECYPNTVPAKKTRWVTYGRPDCWCYARNCKGDATGTSDGKSPNGPYWVSVSDLNVLKSAWNKLDAALAGNNICGDFNRASDGKAPNGPYAVSVSDLNILKSNWNIINGPASGLCEATKAVVPASGPMP
ncbi:MAG: hypothetical protein Q7T18_00285 [Sedimentisphaerales bacterium]|nr:hypothetical protein [Sedimentisphaerales bacterium]